MVPGPPGCDPPQASPQPRLAVVACAIPPDFPRVIRAGSAGFRHRCCRGLQALTMPTTLASSIWPPPTRPQSGSHHESDHRRSRRGSNQTPVAIDRFHVRRVTLADPKLTVTVLRVMAAQRWKPVIEDGSALDTETTLAISWSGHGFLATVCGWALTRDRFSAAAVARKALPQIPSVVGPEPDEAELPRWAEPGVGVPPSHPYPVGTP